MSPEYQDPEPIGPGLITVLVCIAAVEVVALLGLLWMVWR